MIERTITCLKCGLIIISNPKTLFGDEEAMWNEYFSQDLSYHFYLSGVKNKTAIYKEV